MFDMLWKDETLTGTDFVAFVTDGVKAMAVDTVKEEILGQAFFAIRIMMRRSWIITQPANVHLPQERIVLDA